MARGGKRAGMQGRNYSNRTDLNANRQPTGGLSAPVPAAPQTGGPALPAQPTQQLGAPPAGPPPILNALRPTERPNEPLTHGLPTGPGGGPEVLQQTGIPAATDYLGQLRAIYQQFPTEALRDLIAFNSGGAI